MSLRRFACLALSLLLVACDRRGSGASRRQLLSIRGSDTMVVLGQKWAEAFMRAHGDVSVEVTGGGSGPGIAALVEGVTDVCLSSRPMREVELQEVQRRRGVSAMEWKVGFDALAIYVSVDNPVQEIDLAQLARIYLGQARRWEEIGGAPGPITVYGRTKSSGSSDYFQEHVLGGRDFAADVQPLSGTSAVVNAIKSDPSGIGYGGIGYASGVRALRVRRDQQHVAVAPNGTTTLDGSYPIRRDLLIYTAAKEPGVERAFVAFVLSPEGQKLVAETGYFPLPR